MAKRRQLGAYPGGSDALEIERRVNAVRLTTQDMYEEEARLLIQRNQTAEAGRQLTKLIALVGAALALGLWTLARFAVNREIDISSRAQSQINMLNADLETRVSERTSALLAEIAERERAEQFVKDTLAASGVVLQELADQKFALDQHAIVATTDVQGTITYVNDKFCTISKYSRDELLGQNHRILNSGIIPEHFSSRCTTPSPMAKYGGARSATGPRTVRFYWVDTTIVPFLEPNGKPRQYMAIRADITERKRRKNTRARLAAVVDSSDDAIISKTLDRTIETWNRGAEMIFGYSAEEAIGKAMLMLFPPSASWKSEKFSIASRVARALTISKP